MTTVQPCHRPRLPPSKLAPKILCSAYEPRPFPEGKEGELLRGRHAFAQSWTIKRHLRLSYTLFDIDLPEDGKRIDLVFLSPEGKMRICEVKSHKQIREVDKIQAALYWSPKYDEVVVSTPDIDLILTIDYIREVRTAANITQEFLNSQPQLAASRHSPHPDVCRICGRTCPPATSRKLNSHEKRR
jgi:hypothetical protein